MRHSHLLTALVCAASLVVVQSASEYANASVSAVDPATVTEVAAPQGFTTFFATNSPTHALVNSHLPGYYRWTIGTETFLRLPDGVRSISTDGLFGFETVWPNTVNRHNLATNDVDTYTIPFTTDWGLSSVATTSSNGRYLGLDADSGVYAASRSFIFDTQTRTLVVPDPQGVSTLRDGFTTKISDNGDVIEFVERTTAGATFRRVRWVRSTDTRTILEDPVTNSSASPDGHWSIELSATHGLVRTHVDSGLRRTIPINGDDVVKADVYNGGRVLIEHKAATATFDQAYQLSSWDGPTTGLLLLSIGVDSAPADYGVGPTSEVDFVANPDATRVAFATTATNLAPERTQPGPWRLFQVPLPPLQPVVPVAPNESYCMLALGAVPNAYVAVNVTPVSASARGNGAVHSSDDPPPATANVNFGPGTVDPNVAVVKAGADGKICFTNSDHASVHVILDALVIGDAGVFTLPTPGGAVRIANTRSGLGGSKIAPSTTRCVSAHGTPGDYTAVNITPVDADARGNGALHSSNDEPPATANVNFGPGTVDPNVAIVQIGTDGKICFTNSEHGNVNIILDQLVNAAAAAFSLPTANGAVRIANTRSGLGGSKVAPSTTRCVSAHGTPGDYTAVNVTPVDADARGNGSLHSSNDTPPATANVNFGPGTVDPNVAIVQIGTDGKICFTNSEHGNVNIILDQLVNAAAAAFSLPTANGAVRLTDTRVARD